MTDFRRSGTLLDWLQIDRDKPEPLYRQIADQLRRAIIDGRLPPGAALPPTRDLAQRLGLARNTALQAYEVLMAEGCLLTVRGAGTTVAPLLAASGGDGLRRPALLLPPAAAMPQVLPPDAYAHEPPVLAFRPGIPAFDHFPRRIWGRLLNRQALNNHQSLLDYTHPGGSPALRAGLARYLTMSRGVSCGPEQVIIVSSTRAACTLLAQLLLSPGATVAVEDPGYLAVKRIMLASGRKLRLLPVDDHGARIDDLIADPQDCAATFLTPTHHWPTGATLSAARRLALLRWAAAGGAWIFEDDYDGIFHFDGAAPPTLYSLASSGVIFLGSFSKLLAPSIRCAWLVVPPGLVGLFETHCYRHGIEPPLHVQAALADFLNEGHFVRHLAAMRRVCADRRAMLADGLTRHFGGALTIRPRSGGLQVVADLPKGTSARAFSAAAGAAHLVARPLHAYQIAGPIPEMLQFGFAGVPEDQIDNAVARLRQATVACC